MALDFKLELSQQQELIMTPELQTAIEVLQYSSLELKEFLEAEEEKNPLLELESFTDNNYYNYNQTGENDFDYENLVAAQPDPCQYLSERLFEVLTESEIKLGNFIVGCLNREAELSFTFAEIAQMFSEQFNQIEQEEVELVYNKVKELDLESAFKVKENISEYVIPDLIVKKIAGEFIVEFNQSALPNLQISSYYYNLWQQTNDSETMKYLEKKYKAAVWLIKSIKQRQQTIKKIAEAIVAEQSAFLEAGFKFLSVMTMSDIADLISMHESTVSRASTSKYIQTDRGTFPLKFFFNSGVAGISAVSLKAIIAEEIAAEKRANPLSDKQLAGLIAENYQLNISRRTVAKYRNSLGIAGSRSRKK